MDSRNTKLAKNILNYSVKLKKGEKVLISSNGFSAVDLVKELIRETYNIGGIPFVNISSSSIERELLMNVTEEQLLINAESDALKMEKMDAYVGIGASENSCEMADVPAEKMDMYGKLYTQKVHHDIRLKKKWVVLRYPNYSMAQMSNMSTEKFEDFYFNVCNLDYSKMDNAMNGLYNLMNKTDKVHILGKGTDLTFSIKNIGAAKCMGECNIPDGEVYTAPVKNSVNGYITYNTETRYNGVRFNNIRFDFKDGKIIKATSDSNNDEELEKILNIDEGARYIGEFAFGVNPYIDLPIGDTLFDEKIFGSFHFTPGDSLEETDNGNHSSIHWDIVNIQRPEFGGGEIYFDDVLIRKDGLFVLEELKPLNPENLK